MIPVDQRNTDRSPTSTASRKGSWLLSDQGVTARCSTIPRALGRTVLTQPIHAGPVRSNAGNGWQPGCARRHRSWRPPNPRLRGTPSSKSQSGVASRSAYRTRSPGMPRWRSPAVTVGRPWLTWRLLW